jgi:hypothetical protein
MKLVFGHETFGTWVFCQRCPTGAEVRCFLTVLGFNENTWVENALYFICTEVGFARLGAVLQGSKYTFENFLIDLPFKLGKL